MLTNDQAIFVNRYSSYIDVYDSLTSSNGHVGGITVGGNKIGRIHPDEFYTLLKSDTPNVTSYGIIFQNSNGNRSRGYIETSPGYSLGSYAWKQYQEPFHYYNSNGSTLVSSKNIVIDGTSYRQFTVKVSVIYRDKTGAVVGALAAGTLLATNSSTAGQSYPDHMIFYKKKVGSVWENLCSSGYGFVDMRYDAGAMPNNRRIW